MLNSPSEEVSIKPSKLYEALQALIGERVPLHIWGACGVGKSQIVSQVASDLDYDFLHVRAVQLDPVDLRSLPRIAEGKTEWVPPKFLPTPGKGILFHDELTTAPQMTQAGCYHSVLDRKLGEYLLPDGWVVIAAGNPALELGVHFAMSLPLRKRFVHLGCSGGQNGGQHTETILAEVTRHIGSFCLGVRTHHHSEIESARR
jgi:MoxR-like ATPase